MDTFRRTREHATFASRTICVFALCLLSACQGGFSDEHEITTETEELSNSSSQLREFIGSQVGGIDKLKVPADDA